MIGIKESYRLLQFIRWQRRDGYPAPNAPHLDNECIRRLERELTRCSLYLEYGSGGSTLLAAQIGATTISVENDFYYAGAVRKALPAGHRVRILTPRLGFTKEWGYPIFFAALKGRRYVEAPVQPLAGNSPDLILVDGRYRVACSLRSAQMAYEARTDATLIIDDYVDRPHYHSVESFIGKPDYAGRAAVFRVGKNAIPEAAIRRAMKDPR